MQLPILRTHRRALRMHTVTYGYIRIHTVTCGYTTATTQTPHNRASSRSWRLLWQEPRSSSTAYGYIRLQMTIYGDSTPTTQMPSTSFPETQGRGGRSSKAARATQLFKRKRYICSHTDIYGYTHYTTAMTQTPTSSASPRPCRPLRQEPRSSLNAYGYIPLHTVTPPQRPKRLLILSSASRKPWRPFAPRNPSNA